MEHVPETWFSYVFRFHFSGGALPHGPPGSRGPLAPETVGPGAFRAWGQALANSSLLTGFLLNHIFVTKWVGLRPFEKPQMVGPRAPQSKRAVQGCYHLRFAHGRGSINQYQVTSDMLRRRRARRSGPLADIFSRLWWTGQVEKIRRVTENHVLLATVVMQIAIRISDRVKRAIRSGPAWIAVFCAKRVCLQK